MFKAEDCWNYKEDTGCSDCYSRYCPLLEYKSKKSWKKFNINNKIKVKLTEYGMDLYYHRFDFLNTFVEEEILEPSYPKMDKEGFTIFQLWDFMNIFGPHLNMGSDTIIEGNAIYFQEKDLEEV